MPADLALDLLGAMAGPAAGGDDDGDGGDPNGLRWRQNADGSRSASFGSIDDLRAFLRGGGEVPGVRRSGQG